MKKYRRIEITAFRRRVLIVSGEQASDTGEVEVLVNEADSNDTIEPASEEGQETLIEAIRLLEQRIGKPAGPPIERPDVHGCNLTRITH